MKSTWNDQNWSKGRNYRKFVNDIPFDRTNAILIKVWI